MRLVTTMSDHKPNIAGQASGDIERRVRDLVVDDCALTVIEGCLKEIVHEPSRTPVDSGYIRKELGHDYVGETCISEYDPRSQYWCIMSSIGPISILKARLEPVIAEWEEGPQQMSIHYVSTSPLARGKGLADRLYKAIAQDCTKTNAFLCRGQPDPMTDLAGYTRRQTWLEQRFPDLRLVEYHHRDHLEEILRHAPWLKEAGGERWKESVALIKKMMREHPDSEEVAILRACAALSCMPR